VGVVLFTEKLTEKPAILAKPLGVVVSPTLVPATVVPVLLRMAPVAASST